MRWGQAFSLATLAMLSACTQLPIDGPTAQNISGSASAALSNPPNAVVYDYALVDVNPVVLDCLVDSEAEVEHKSLFSTIGNSAGPPAVQSRRR